MNSRWRGQPKTRRGNGTADGTAVTNETRRQNGLWSTCHRVNSSPGQFNTRQLFSHLSSFGKQRWTKQWWIIQNLQAVWEAATIYPCPCKLTFWPWKWCLESCDMGYLCANFTYRLMPPPYGGEGITVSLNGNLIDWLVDRKDGSIFLCWDWLFYSEVFNCRVKRDFLKCLKTDWRTTKTKEKMLQ